MYVCVYNTNAPVNEYSLCRKQFSQMLGAHGRDGKYAETIEVSAFD